MATYHLSIKSRKKGTAADHASYITRQQRHRRDDVENDLVTTGFGNMPTWTNGNPLNFWKAADKFERANGSAARELVLALPRELTGGQQEQLILEMIQTNLAGLPYLYAIHNPTAAIDGDQQPHGHIVYSDRRPDGVDRSPSHFFRRYNATNPEAGGAKKQSGGRTPVELRAEVVQLRKSWADLQNTALAQNGHSATVDHRSLSDQGVERMPESHLGQSKIKAMSPEEKRITKDAREHDIDYYKPRGLRNVAPPGCR